MSDNMSKAGALYGGREYSCSHILSLDSEAEGTYIATLAPSSRVLLGESKSCRQQSTLKTVNKMKTASNTDHA